MFGEKNMDISDKDNFLNTRILLYGNMSPTFFIITYTIQ